MQKQDPLSFSLKAYHPENGFALCILMKEIASKSFLEPVVFLAMRFIASLNTFEITD